MEQRNFAGVYPVSDTMTPALTRFLPRRRTWLKAMHWTMLPLLIWFVLVSCVACSRQELKTLLWKMVQ